MARTTFVTLCFALLVLSEVRCFDANNPVFDEGVILRRLTAILDCTEAEFEEG